MSREVEFEGEALSLDARPDPARDDGFTVMLGQRAVAVTARRLPDGALAIALPDGRQVRAVVSRDGADRWVSVGGQTTVVREARPRSRSGAGDHSLEAPMPGKVLVVHVAPGDVVVAGQALLVVEAMKMEHALKAPRDGTVKSVAASAGDMVNPGVALVTFEDVSA